MKMKPGNWIKDYSIDSNQICVILLSNTMETVNYFFKPDGGVAKFQTSASDLHFMKSVSIDAFGTPPAN